MLHILSLLLSFTVSAEIIRPSPREFSQVSDFQAEWCASALEPAQTVTGLCFGRSRFKGFSVRSVLLRRPSGANELYVESDWRGVELMKPVFGAIGPIFPGSGPVEEASVSLQWDADGRETGLRFHAPSTGFVRALR